jgi:D-alanine-D-alanine ligase
MRIGLTYDLRSEYLAMGYGAEETAEFDREETVDALAAAIRANGHEPIRVGHVRSLVAHLARGERWDAVFNICEGLRGFGREAQVPALLDAYDIPCTFADPLTAALTLHKGMAKRVLRDSGVPTTDFRLVATEADVDRVDLAFPLFVKPVAEGTAKGVHPTSRVVDRDGLRVRCRELLAAFRQPVLVEPFLPGREFTTGLVGEGDTARAVGTIEIVLLEGKAEAHAYTYLNKEESEERCAEMVLAPEPWASRCAEIAVAAWRALGCRDAGRIDLRADDAGRLMVLEANPLPGMHPNHSDLPVLCRLAGMPYEALVGSILSAALARSRA